MRTGKRATKFALYCLAALACLQAADSPAAEIAIAERPVYRNGDVFEYVDRFQTVACKRWEISGHDASGAVMSRCGDNIAYFSPDSGALLRIATRDGRELVKFEPFAPAIPFPLQVGSRWGGHFQVSTADDLISPSLDERCEAVAFETVKVAAGDLPSFRFDCVTEWSVWPLHGTVTVTSWYAPAAKTVVKSVNGSDPKWNLELAGSRLK
jgi:hypothetical protein